MSQQQSFTSEEIIKMINDVSDDKEPMDVSEKSSTGSNTERRPTASVGTDPLVRERARSTSSASTSSAMPSSVLPRAYANVRAARRASSTVRSLNGGAVTECDLGSFVNSNDSRVTLANHRHCYKTKTNISSSFALDTMICNSCVVTGQHRMLRRETEREDTVNDSPLVFVLSDQCFPPVLPPDCGGGLHQNNAY
jgi:hypothetical protein